MRDGSSMPLWLSTHDVTLTFEMEAQLTPAFDALARLEPPARRFVLTLAGGRWPARVRKGRTMSLSILGHTFEGRIVYRRMRRLVMEEGAR